MKSHYDLPKNSIHYLIAQIESLNFPPPTHVVVPDYHYHMIKAFGIDVNGETKIIPCSQLQTNT